MQFHCPPSSRFTRRAVLALSFLVSIILSQAPRAQYVVNYPTSTDTRPEVQSMRLVNGQTGTLNANWTIYVETGNADYDTIAAIVRSGIKASTGYGLTIASLSSRSDAYDQIVIGQMSQDSIAALAARYQRNTVGLGDEGYNLISLPNAASGKWLVLVAAETVSGARHGAYTLLDLIDAPTSGVLKNVRIRDYPDSPHREVQHWLPEIPDTADADADAWLADRKTEFDKMGAWGANAVALGRRDFVRIVNKPSGLSDTLGHWLKPAALFARTRGVEPGVDFDRPPSGHRWEREGWYVDREPFAVKSDSSLKPLYEFINTDFNMSFDVLNGSGWPAQWDEVSTDPGWGDSLGWSTVDEGGDIHIRLEQEIGKRSRLVQTIYEPPDLENLGLQGFSLYVLTVRFAEVDWGVSDPGFNNPKLAIRVGGTLKDGACSGSELELLPSPPFEANTFDLTAWATKNPLDPYTGTFKPAKTNGTPRTDDYYFWTPPTAEQDSALGLTAAGFTCPHFEDVKRFFIQIETLDPEQFADSVVMEIEDLYLERRSSALRNVMRWYEGDLAFTITDSTGTTPYTEDGDYHYDPPPDTVNYPEYRMKTFPAGRAYPDINRSVVTWWDSAAVGNTVYISYTTGVPADWSGGGQLTAYCLNHPS